MLARLRPTYGGRGLLSLASRARNASGIPYSELSIGVPKETAHLERRVAQTPETVTKLTKEGFTVKVESGAGAAASFSGAHRPRRRISSPSWPRHHQPCLRRQQHEDHSSPCSHAQMRPTPRRAR